MNEVDRNAKIIWDYMFMHHELKPADAIFVLGSNDKRVAVYAAELYKEKLAPYIIFSGGNGWDSTLEKPEADVFAEIAIKEGVPDDKIIRERESSNTGENILFTKKLVEERNLPFHSYILVQKRYMERRTYAAFKKLWPGVDCVVASDEVSYEDYATDPDQKERFINSMVGDLQRIKEYPAKGFQIEQEIPDEVLRAYECLVALGYTKRLIKPV